MVSIILESKAIPAEVEEYSEGDVQFHDYGIEVDMHGKWDIIKKIIPWHKVRQVNFH